MRDKIALFDMDGTIADYVTQLRKDLEKLGSETLSEDFLNEPPEWLKERMNLVKSQKGWWETLPPIESGMGLIELCKDIGFHVNILTQAPAINTNGWTEKYHWCEKNVKPIAPDYNIIVTRGGKGLVYGRVFFDDWPPFMEAWLEHRPRGLGLMPITSENRTFSHPQVVKYDYNNWRTPELEQRLREAYSRE